jgi:hypothetical protein
VRKIHFLLLLLPALCGLPALLFADEVFLKGGGTFAGRIVEQTETMVTVNIGDGVVGVPMSRVDRIVKGRSPLHEYDEKAAKLGARDTAGWRSLGHWAMQQGLSAQSRQAYEKVISVAPDDPEAREALGYVLIDGRWLTEEESYRARGFVKYDGEWMTPEEAKVAQSDAAADQARQDAEQRAKEAEIDAMQAEARAHKAEERAKWAESTQSWNLPVAWGGWGYGMTAWPSSTTVSKWPDQQWPPPPQ